MASYYIGEIGTLIKVDVGVDVSSAETLELHVKKPSGKMVVWPATLEGTQELRYTILEGDWAESGRYYLQAYIVMDGWTGYGETASFEIKRKFAK